MMITRGTFISILFTAAIGSLASANAPAVKGDRELGEHLSNLCTACHQVSGRQVGGIPAIVGWPEDQFVAVIQSYKDGTRDNETMRTLSHRLSQEDIDGLAAYFGSLKPVAGAK